MSLVSDIQELLDETGTSVFWPLQQIFDAANSALIEIYARTRHKKVSAPMDVFMGSTHIPLPVDVIMIPQYITRNNKEYFITTYEHLERYNLGWQGEPAGEPIAFVSWDWKHVRPWPTPDADYMGFYLWGVPWPEEIKDGVYDVNDDRVIKRAVAYLAASKLCEATQPGFSEVYRAQSSQQEYEFIKQKRSEHTYKIRGLKPTRDFALTRTGNIRIIQGYR